MSQSAPDSESTELISEGTNKSGTSQSTPLVSLTLFAILQLFMFVCEGVFATIGVQFARNKFADQRNFILPEGVNACASDNHSHVLIEIQSETALFSTYQSFVLNLIPIFTGLPLIAASDYVGRRPMILLRCLGILVTALGFLAVAIFDWSVYFALIGCVCNGLTGGFSVSQAIGMLYVTDIVTVKQRGVALTAVYGGQYAVFYTAQLVIGIILQASDFIAVYAINFGFALLAVLWALSVLLLRESIPNKRPMVAGVILDVFKNIRQLIVNATDGRLWRICVILSSYALVSLCMFAFQNSVTLYALGEPFCWTPSVIGIFTFMYGVPNSILSPVFVWVIKLITKSDYWSIYISTVSGIIEYVVTAEAESTAVLIYAASFGGIFYSISQPVFVSFLSKLVPQSRQGALFSLYTLVTSVTTAASMILQSYAYSAAVTAGFASQLFYVMAILTALVFIPTVILHVLEPKDGFQSESTE